jgi:hypothetical protein
LTDSDGCGQAVLGFTPRGQPLLAALEVGEEVGPGQYRYWLSVRDVSNGEKTFRCENPTRQETGSSDMNYYSRIALSPDGTLLACVCDNRALLWKVAPVRK